MDFNISILFFSNKYDYRNADPSWVCFFCQKQSHYQRLGDLFGPYYVPSKIIKSREPPTSSESPKKGAKKRRKSELSGKRTLLATPIMLTPGDLSRGERGPPSQPGREV